MRTDLRKRSWRSFGVLFLGLALFVGGWRWLWQQTPVGDLPAPVRQMLEWNGQLWARLYNPARLSVARAPVPGTIPRVNGDIGLEAEIDLRKWKLSVNREEGGSASGSGNALTITMADLKSLPRVDTAVQFRCIEGWSEEMSFAGVRFSDFL
jgi:DMSO/TMAO reductase YedYZ molybdopterin-dependent catalytic subunit